MWPFKRRKMSEIKLNHKHYLFGGRPASELRLQPIKKEGVLAEDLHDLDYIIDDVKQNLIEHGDSVLWNIRIQWDADDEREPYEIKQIRAWHKAAHARFAYLPIFLSEMTLGPYLACLLDIVKVKGRKPNKVVFFVSESLINLLGGILIKGMAFYEYCKVISMECGHDDKINDEKTVSLLNAFIDRSLRSLKIDNSELMEYRDSIRGRV